MKKMPCLFDFDYPQAHKRVYKGQLNQKAVALLEACQDVVATVKRDGTATKLENGKWFTRRMVRDGKTAPEGFQPMSYDEKTEKTFGWEPVENSPYKNVLVKGIINTFILGGQLMIDGTYELCGPTINNNPEGLDEPKFFRHGSEKLDNFPDLKEILSVEDPREFLKPYFQEFKNKGIEGVVFWGDGEPLVKLRVKDFENLS